jgi:hypothetical protein
VFEQGNASGKTPMINLSSSSDEENFIVDTSHDAKLTKKNFLTTSTATSSGCLAMARSSSSMIMMKKIRHRRRRLLASNPWPLLLPPTRPQVLPLAPMMLLQG